jgi:hypothetical protein
LTGIHLMRTGAVEANLVILHEEYRLPCLAELVNRKITCTEKGTMASPELDFHRKEYERLVTRLELRRLNRRFQKHLLQGRR